MVNFYKKNYSGMKVAPPDIVLLVEKHMHTAMSWRECDDNFQLKHFQQKTSKFCDTKILGELYIFEEGKTRKKC